MARSMQSCTACHWVRCEMSIFCSHSAALPNRPSRYSGQAFEELEIILWFTSRTESSHGGCDELIERRLFLLGNRKDHACLRHALSDSHDKYVGSRSWININVN